MNLNEMTNRTLIDNLTNYPYAQMYAELESRLCAPKQPYQIKYKWVANDRYIDDMKALTVWGTSPVNACQTLVDANDWRNEDMEFMVDNVCITSKQLE